ncbi:MAG TPA: NAD(P)-binding domain-containing protein [Armatimonadota bacterium]|nr:NAD(P)-binding domain-containing protein [Armatimonadota bacterium]
MDIGFIGLGTMGRPMVRNLLKAGHKVTIYGRRKSVVDEFVAAGAFAAGSPCEAAQASDVVITMLPDSPDVKQVVAGEGGVLRGARPGTVVVDMSTISPSVARDIFGLAAAKGVDFLDAPVSGGETGAVAGTLSIMVGGKQEVYEKCVPVFQALGKNVTYMGESGAGQMTKLCNQVICALNIQAVCEGLMLGAKAGLDMEKLLSVVSAGAAGSWMLSSLAPKMLARDFEPGFKVRLQQKDLRLALAAAEELKLPLPAARLVHQLFRAVEAAGMGEKGTQALIAALEKLAESTVSGAARRDAHESPPETDSSC